MHSGIRCLCLLARWIWIVLRPTLQSILRHGRLCLEWRSLQLRYVRSGIQPIYISVQLCRHGHDHCQWLGVHADEVLCLLSVQFLCHYFLQLRSTLVVGRGWLVVDVGSTRLCWRRASASIGWYECIGCHQNGRPSDGIFHIQGTSREVHPRISRVDTVWSLYVMVGLDWIQLW